MITPEELARLSSLMDSAFKFKVGDIVQPAALGDYAEKPSGYGTSTKRGSPDSWFHISFTNSNAYRYQIIERWLQQCHGGIQKHYDVRLVDNRGLIEGPCRRLTEPELTLSAPYREIGGMSKKKILDWVNGLPDDKEDGADA